MSCSTLIGFVRGALLSTVLMAAPASAALLDVTVTTNILSTDFFSGTDTVFGVAPADLIYSATFRVDTTAGPPSSAAAGDPTDGFVFGHDVFGYNVVSATATFGSKTWDSADFVTLEFGSGITSSLLFVDKELASGVVPDLISVRMEDSDGFLFIGVIACGGATCQISEDFQVRDFNGGVLDATNDFVLTTNYSIAVADAAVPVPASLLLLALGVAGVGWLRKAGRLEVR